MLSSRPLTILQMEPTVTKEDLEAAKELTEERIKRLDDALLHLRELSASQRTSDKLAVETALTAAKELSQAHNGLLRKIEKLIETFPTKEVVEARFSRVESFQAKMTGGLIVVGAVGLGNFIRVWLS